MTDKNGNEIDNNPKWKGLVRNAERQGWYDSDLNKKEKGFWLGK